jgi:hypothetical protein
MAKRKSKHTKRRTNTPGGPSGLKPMHPMLIQMPVPEVTPEEARAQRRAESEKAKKRFEQVFP